MRIGIDVRPLSRSKTGIFRYLRNIIDALPEIDSENTYFLYSDRDFDLALESERWRKRIRSRFSFLPGSVWLQTDAKKMAIEDGLDVFWGPAHALPLGLPATIKKILTVHDVVWRAFPETMSAYNGLVHRLVVEKSIRQADALLADSKSTKMQIEQCIKTASSAIHVVYLGVEGCYHPQDHARAAEQIAQKFRVSMEYIFAVGTVEPRKNLVTLIEAFQILREKHQFKGQLLLAGGQGWGKSNVHSRMLELGLTEREVKFLGFVPEEDMPTLYSGALAFVFPSLYEGFGLPLVEAMACGAPVVASNTSSVPEVVGDAGLLAEPHNPGEFAGAIFRVASDPEFRAKLSARGLERARLFNWGLTTRNTLDVLTSRPSNR